MTKTLSEAMADGSIADAIGNALPGGTPAPEAPAAIPAPPAEPEPAAPTPITDVGGLKPEELALFAKEGAEPKPEAAEKPETIKGTPFVTEEALAEGFKNLQRENQRLRDSYEKNYEARLKTEVKSELAKLLSEVPPAPPAESEEEKKLKTDDPESYRVLQLERQLKAQNETLEKVLQGMSNFKKSQAVREIQSTFKTLAADKKVPYEIMMAYSSLPQFANTAPEEVANEVAKIWKEAVEASTKDNAPPPAPSPTPVLRSPATGGAIPRVSEGLTVEDLGTFGSRKFAETKKKMAAIFQHRFAGGGA